jgi:putative ATP-dependent endonuclease of the OLD family
MAMRLSSVRIENFRSCANAEINFNNYTCLVGPNGAGKSTILHALNIFFRSSEELGVDAGFLQEEDFHKKNTEWPVAITLTFGDLEPPAIEDFADYVRHDQLVISAIAKFSSASGRAEVKQYGQRLVVPEFKEYFVALSEKAKKPQLLDIYERIRKRYTDLIQPSTIDSMTDALRNYEENHRELCKLEPSEDEFYGFSKGINRLAKYVQWVYVPAVKDVMTEQAEARNTALGKLLARTVRLKTRFDARLDEMRKKTLEDYEKLLAENQGALKDLSASLQKRIEEWAHPEASISLEWHNDPAKSVEIREPFAQVVAGEHNFTGDLCRFGHGLRRSYLLALLQELAATPSGETLPRLILACEEPELYQHPPQAKHLAEVFKKLGEANSQVIVCTHSPYFVSGEGFEDVRMVRKDPPQSETRVSYSSHGDLLKDWAEITGGKPKKPQGVLAKIHQELQPQLNEMFFTNALILVEGVEDIAFITTYLHLANKWEEYRRCGCHLVSTGGKSHMVFAALLAQRVNIPTYIVFDSDADKPDKNGSWKQHENDNAALLKLAGIAEPEPMPKATFWAPNIAMWGSDIATVVESEVGKDLWHKYQERANADYGHPGGPPEE